VRVFGRAAVLRRRGGGVAGLATVARPDAATLVLGAGSPRTVATVPIFARPAEGTVHVTPRSATAWEAQAIGAPTSTRFDVAELSPSTTYRVMRRGELMRTVTSNAAGVVSFTTTVGRGASIYAIER
jgi:hypothetical protein